MDKILFFDNSIDYLFYSPKNKTQIIDYFDIEAQRALPYLGYSFKRNPKLIIAGSQLKTSQNQFDYVCNLNSYKSHKHQQSLDSIPYYGIIFDCYL